MELTYSSSLAGVSLPSCFPGGFLRSKERDIWRSFSAPRGLASKIHGSIDMYSKLGIRPWRLQNNLTWTLNIRSLGWFCEYHSASSNYEVAGVVQFNIYSFLKMQKNMVLSSQNRGASLNHRRCSTSQRIPPTVRENNGSWDNRNIALIVVDISCCPRKKSASQTHQNPQ